MQRLARRDFLRAVAVLAGPRLLSACGEGGPLAPNPSAFPQSVASGDPRPTSVVLWTRAVDSERPADDLELVLLVATDAALTELVELGGDAELHLVAEARVGGCVKVRVDGLEPGTTYYYRFTLLRKGERVHSRVGRTRTAPDPDSEDPVSFAVLSCQDYGGKYFHAYRHLAEKTVDFVLHLGDYVYETTGDPSFQSGGPGRNVSFSAPEEALSLGDGAFLAARSLGNYRDLYRTYRSDPDLQRAHELFPFILIPDDHEFSNDCHGATASYTNGREDEQDFARRRAADRAWFEYMPLDYLEPPTLALTDDAEFPDDFRIYRSFVFGRHLELVLSDLRRYRPDHLVPEEAFPGAVFLSEAEAVEVLGALPEDAVPYVDVDADEHEALRSTLRELAGAQGLEGERIAGLLSVPWLNELSVLAGGDALVDPEDEALERGYAYHQLLKTEAYSAQGARYLLAERPFRALAAQRYQATEGKSELVMGEAQREWFTRTLKASTRTFKVWGNEFTLMPKRLDLTTIELAPEMFRQPLLLNADDWDGAPNERNALLRELAEVENLVVVTGDIHSFFAGTPGAENQPETRVIELVAGSVSSTTWQRGIELTLEQSPELPPEAALLAQLAGPLLTDDDIRANPHLAWLDLESNGYALVTVGPGALEATAYTIADDLIASPADKLPRSLSELFVATEFRTLAGSRELEQRFDGAWKRWDPASFRWE